MIHAMRIKFTSTITHIIPTIFEEQLHEETLSFEELLPAVWISQPPDCIFLQSPSHSPPSAADEVWYWLKHGLAQWVTLHIIEG